MSGRLFRLLKAPATGPVCVVMGLTMVAFGLPFLNMKPHNFFQTPGFRAMSALAPETVWGVALSLLGLWRVAAAVWGSFRQRKLSTVAAIFAWCLLFLLFVLSEPSNPGVTVFGVWTMLETWTFFRLSRWAVWFVAE